MKHTGLSFVFATWIANKKLPQQFIDDFNEANAFGLQHINEVINETGSSYFDLKKYYTNYISYDLNNEKRKGMKLFLQLLNASVRK